MTVGLTSRVRCRVRTLNQTKVSVCPVSRVRMSLHTCLWTCWSIYVLVCVYAHACGSVCTFTDACTRPWVCISVPFVRVCVCARVGPRVSPHASPRACGGVTVEEGGGNGVH